MLDYLRDAWASDRRAEWSIWMVYTKVDMPHQYINSSFEDAYNLMLGSTTRKLIDDVCICVPLIDCSVCWFTLELKGMRIIHFFVRTIDHEAINFVTAAGPDCIVTCRTPSTKYSTNEGNCFCCMLFISSQM